ncbi:unnamed protein product [Symbiodinium natans]|uniref:FAST kinase leucine-rich domain-containing protein n=1 Tax=Symbiodinium natans TaxID=878477 RepID=A0A812H194_9DINO|nr:unnamed protein product [Symbiodinium natans]
MAALDLAPDEQARLMPCLASAALADPELFRAQELANSIWALATCGSGLASQAAQQLTIFCVERRLRALQPIQLAAVTWAVAAAGLAEPVLRSSPAPPPLMSRLAGAACGRGPEFGPQEVANISWAMAIEAVHHPALREELATAARRLAPAFSRKELVNTLWAFAVLGNSRS